MKRNKKKREVINLRDIRTSGMKRRQSTKLKPIANVQNENDDDDQQPGTSTQKKDNSCSLSG